MPAYINGGVFQDNIPDAYHILFVRRFLVGIVFAFRQTEKSGGHIIRRLAFRTDGQSGNGISAAVITAGEGIGKRDPLLFGAVKILSCPANGQKFAGKGNVSALPEPDAFPVHVPIDGRGKIAQLFLIGNQIRLCLRTGSAAKAGRIRRVISRGVSNGGFDRGQFHGFRIPFIGLCAGKNIRRGNFALADVNPYRYRLIRVPAIPDAVLRARGFRRDFFRLRLYIDAFRRGIGKGDNAVLLCPHTQRVGRYAKISHVNGIGGKVSVQNPRNRRIGTGDIRIQFVRHAARIHKALVGFSAGHQRSHRGGRQRRPVDRHNRIMIVKTVVRFADAGNPAADHAGIRGRSQRGNIPACVRTGEGSGVAADQRSRDRLALIAPGLVRTGGNTPQRITVGSQSPVIQARQTASLGEILAIRIRGRGKTGDFHIRPAVDNRAPVLIGGNSARPGVAVGLCQRQHAGNRTAVNDSARVIVRALVRSVQHSGNTAQTGIGGGCHIDRHIGQIHIFHTGMTA